MTEKKEREEQLKALRVELSELYKKRQEGKDVPRDLTRIDEMMRTPGTDRNFLGRMVREASQRAGSITNRRKTL